MPGYIQRSCRLAAVLAAVTASTAVVAQESEDATSKDSPKTSDLEPADEPTTTEPSSTPDTPRDVARELYREGEAAYRAGRYLEAVSKFKQAARQEPNPALSYNIALAYDAVGEVAEALHWYRDYLRRLPAAPDRNEVRTNIRQLESRLQKLGVQQVSIMSDPEGAKVQLDNEIVGTTPWTGQTTPGEHRVQLTLPGYSPSTVEFTLAEDRAMDVRLVLMKGTAATEHATGEAQPPAPAGTAAVADAPTEQSEAKARVRARTWVLLGGGVGLLGTGVGFEAARSSAEQDARDTEIQLEARDSIDKMRRYESTARTFAAIGGVVTVVGGLSLVYDLRTSRPARAQILPDGACGADGCWLGARGKF